jgi:hypothetical protein
MKITINESDITTTVHGDWKKARAVAEGAGYRCEAECDHMGRSYVTDTYCEGGGRARHNQVSSTTDGTDALTEARMAAESEVAMMAAAAKAGRELGDMAEYSHADGVYEIVFADPDGE